MKFYFVLRVSVIVVMLISIVGCQQNVNHMRLVNYSDKESPEELFQQFTSCSFLCSPIGEYEFLLETNEPIENKSSRILRQVIYGSILWTPQPGKTYAESTQINSKLTYIVEIADNPDATVISQTGKTLLCYRGTGFITFSLDRTGEILSGKIESALLEPTKGTTSKRLGTFSLSGEFSALKNPSAIAEYKITLARLVK
jgi:hypothetical protein